MLNRSRLALARLQKSISIHFAKVKQNSHKFSLVGKFQLQTWVEFHADLSDTTGEPNFQQLFLCVERL